MRSVRYVRGFERAKPPILFGGSIGLWQNLENYDKLSKKGKVIILPL